MAALPAESITLYIYNRSSDDYLQQLGSRKILDNPMPEHFNGPPGSDPEHPLFFDYDLPEDWPPVEVLTNPKVTACNTSASLPPEMDTSEGIRYYVKARGTVPHVDPVFYIQEHYTIRHVVSRRSPAILDLTLGLDEGTSGNGSSNPSPTQGKPAQGWHNEVLQWKK